MTKRLTKAEKAAQAEAAMIAAQNAELAAQADEALSADEAQAVETLAVETEANEAQADEAQPVVLSAEELRAKAEAAQALLLESVQVRIDNAPSANFAKNMLAELNALSGRNALIAIEKCVELEVDFESLATAYAIADDKAHDYVAIYAAQKIRKSLFALATGMTSVFDGYTRSIMQNLVSLHSLSNRGSQRALSRAIVFDEAMQTEAVRAYKDCAPSTASTQASSTRQAMRFLNVCNVAKSKKDDAMTFTESKAAQKLQAMFNA